MKDIKISIIIPVRNHENTLRSCMETVLLQNLQEIEVICINCGSTDGSFEILSDLAWSDERLLIIKQENKGIDKARNAGIMEAQGEYIAFIDPDDKYYNFKALETLYNKAKENEALVCGGGCSKEEKDEKYAFKEDRFYSYKEYQYDQGFQQFIYDRRLILDNRLFFSSHLKIADSVWFVKTLHKAERFFGVSEKIYSYSDRSDETGFDSDNLSHVISGITDVARIAAENGYGRLLDLENMRMANDLADHIYPYILNKDIEIMKLIHTYNDVSGIKHIETDILANIVRKRDTEAASRNDEIEKLRKDNEKYITENVTLKNALDTQQTELKELNVNMEEVLKELKLNKKTILKTKNANILPYPYYQGSHEKDGIIWTDLGDGRIEATGTATESTSFNLTPPVKETDLKTDNKRYRVSLGVSDVSSFTWYLSGRIAEHKKAKPEWKFLRDVTINDSDGYSESFDIDTTGYDYFGVIAIVIKKGRTVDHLVFTPEICPID